MSFFVLRLKISSKVIRVKRRGHFDITHQLMDRVFTMDRVFIKTSMSLYRIRVNKHRLAIKYLTQVD